MWGKVTSLDKSVFLTQQGFRYNYGKEFRDKNLSRLDQGVLKVGDFSGNKEKRNLVGLIAIHVDDLLISGNGSFLKYMAEMEENSKLIVLRKMARCTSE